MINTTPATSPATGAGSAMSAFDLALMSNPVTAPIGGALAFAGQAREFVAQLTSEFEQMFGIGKGRKEADIIVPKQNELTAIIASADRIRAAGTYSGADLNEVYWVLRQAAQAFYVFIDYPAYAKWPDGRAAKGAYKTIQPAVDDMLRQLQLLVSRSGTALSQIANVGTRGDVSAQLENKLEQMNAIETGDVSQFGGALINGSLSQTGMIVAGALALGAVLLLRRS